MLSPTPKETDRIVGDWMSFARTKIYAFRGISLPLYGELAKAYFRAIVARSMVAIIREHLDEGQPVACAVFEPIDGSSTVFLHWVWTHPRHRNQGLQIRLWSECGLAEANIFVTHLTVLSELFCNRALWDSMHATPRPDALFNPFSLSKEPPDESDRTETSAAEDGHEDAQLAGAKLP